MWPRRRCCVSVPVAAAQPTSVPCRDITDRSGRPAMTSDRTSPHGSDASDETAEQARTPDEAAHVVLGDRQPPPVEEPVPEDVLAVPDEGLEPRPQPAKRVIVIGGGLSGLVAAFELRRQG